MKTSKLIRRATAHGTLRAKRRAKLFLATRWLTHVTTTRHFPEDTAASERLLALYDRMWAAALTDLFVHDDADLVPLG